MLRQMWKKRVCFVLAVILAVIAVTPMEMEHTDAAMVHSVTALMTGNLVNKSNADKLTYRQLETSAYRRKLISKVCIITRCSISRHCMRAGTSLMCPV